MTVWCFSIADADPWSVGVDAAPTEVRKRPYWDVAVPHLAAHRGPPPPRPCIVVCHVRAPAPPGRMPAGPLARAKGLLDALHDDRRSGPTYRQLGVRPPLYDDHPDHVSGLAVEVAAGTPRTDYQLGVHLRIAGQLLASVPVAAEAPNDIAATPDDKAKIAVDRLTYGRAVREAFAAHEGRVQRLLRGLVVRHRPQRDEDNTWATWVAAVCGVRGAQAEHWAAGAPLSGWAPRSVASVADAALEVPVTYQLWG